MSGWVYYHFGAAIAFSSNFFWIPTYLFFVGKFKNGKLGGTVRIFFSDFTVKF